MIRPIGKRFLTASLAAMCLVSRLLVAAPVLGSLTTAIPSPQPLGTPVAITANATDATPGVISYRFQIGASAGALSLVRDFSSDNTFIYTPTRADGNYRFVVVARNNATGQTATRQIPLFQFTSRVSGATSVVSALANPLTALFSSPACATGGKYMRASILLAGSTVPAYTSWQTCNGHSMNFVIAGMRANSNYTITSQTTTGTTTSNGAGILFSTGTPSVSFPAISITVPLTSQDDQSQRFMLMSTLQPFPMAVDLGGHPVWYYVDVSGTPALLTRPLAGGEILLIADGANSAGTSVKSSQILREIDLAGNTIRETNATRVAEQVQALSGITSNCVVGGADCLIGGFSHDAIQLPNGHTLALADEEKIFVDGTQGSSPSNPVDIVGDIIVDLDTNWQVVGYWRAFDHLDAKRAAILGETCAPGAAGCPPILLTGGNAQDWLHGNSLFFSPSDGSVLYSSRHQDWIIKIDYANGSGSGNVLWKLGKGGDFTINSNDPYPWFSHQHDPGFVLNGTTTLAMFDNGNTRVSAPPLGLGSGDSRGYVLQLDQAHKTATPVLLADLGFYSVALGTAELLNNGDYHFEAGFSTSVPPYSESIEVFPNGTLGYTTKINGILCYRNFRMTSLYSPPLKD